jgi:cytochrome b
LLALATVHVAGVLFTSARQRENLAAAMVHGRKRAASE